jgi:4'-phosphopantetheinyl transferase
MQPLDLWHARLDSPAWPSAGALPVHERERAARILRPLARRRWIAARWALRGVLGRYLEREPATVDLAIGRRGKPQLGGGEPLAFNLSHSDGLAVVAVASAGDVGVDVERIGSRPAEFYAAWTRREALAKCHGVGLGAPLPDAAAIDFRFDAGPGFAAAIAVSGEEPLLLRHFVAEPA